MEYILTVKQFREALREGKFLGLKCKQCGAYTVPPRKVCSECQSEDMEIAELSRNGEIQIGLELFQTMEVKAGIGDFVGRAVRIDLFPENKMADEVQAQTVGINLPDEFADSLGFTFPKSYPEMSFTDGRDHQMPPFYRAYIRSAN